MSRPGAGACGQCTSQDRSECRHRRVGARCDRLPCRRVDVQDPGSCRHTTDTACRPSLYRSPIRNPPTSRPCARQCARHPDPRGFLRGRCARRSKCAHRTHPVPVEILSAVRSSSPCGDAFPQYMRSRATGQRFAAPDPSRSVPPPGTAHWHCCACGCSALRTDRNTTPPEFRATCSPPSSIQCPRDRP